MTKEELLGLLSAAKESVSDQEKVKYEEAVKQLNVENVDVVDKKKFEKDFDIKLSNEIKNVNDRLQQSIAASKQKAHDLEEQLKQFNEEREAQALRLQKEAEEKARKEYEEKLANMDLEDRVKEQMQRQAEELEKKFQETQKSYEDKISEQSKVIVGLQEYVDLTKQEKEEAIKQQRIAVIKAGLMKKYGDQVIPELITGDDEESLAASAEKAHQRYKEIRGTASQAHIPITPASVVPSIGTSSVSSLQADTGFQPLTKQQILQLTPEEQQEYGKKLMAFATQ